MIQNIRSGQLSVAEVPPPQVQPGELLIANEFSLVSAGTERMLMEFSNKSLLGKARARPREVKRVLEKVRQDGLVSTLQAVSTRLDDPLAMGYASAGVVLEVGAGVTGFQPGDRVASNGPHAGVVSVPHHLCAKVPDSVPADHAAFTVLGAIALQGIRLADVQLGSTVLVVGLGLVGQLAVGLLRAAGCRVICTDPEEYKCELALSMGAEIARPHLRAQDVESLTGGVGADAVILAASTRSNAPIDLAAGAVRRKGRVVLVGVVGLHLDRDPFFRKEAEFVVSCSYGPGRYDPSYEQGGLDYPIGFVRWTEQRNLQAVVDTMAAGGLRVDLLISHRFPIERAEDAYHLIREGTEPQIGVLLEHPGVVSATARSILELAATPPAGPCGVAVIGVGSFARSVLIPEIVRRAEFTPQTVCSKGGLTAAEAGRKHGFRRATTDESQVWSDPSVGAVFIATRHDLHGDQVLAAIECRKHVFVEKPLCLTRDQLDRIESALADAGAEAPVVTVGFNRRFSPAAQRVRSLFAEVHGPITVSFRFNAGPIPADHWTQDEEVGGGRLLGEACHAIDTATFLAGSPPIRVYADSIGGPDAPAVTTDQSFLVMHHQNGSVSNIGYLAGGDPAFPRERIEVFGAGRVAVIEDFRSVTTVVDGRTRRFRMRKNKGHRAEIEAFARAVTQGGPAPIPWAEIKAVTAASLAAMRSLREHQVVKIG